MEYSLMRNTQRQKSVFLINFHSCSVQYGDKQSLLQSNAGSPSPHSQPWSALISTSGAHKHSQKWYQRWLNLLGGSQMWAGRTRGRHCINTGAARTSLNRRNSGGRGRGRDHWISAVTRHPVGIASQQVAGHCEEATVISLWTGPFMTGRPMGFWEMATIRGSYSTHDMARASNAVLAHGDS